LHHTLTFRCATTYRWLARLAAPPYCLYHPVQSDAFVFPHIYITLPKLITRVECNEATQGVTSPHNLHGMGRQDIITQTEIKCVYRPAKVGPKDKKEIHIN